MPVQLDRNGLLPILIVEVDKTNQPTNPVRVWTEITGYARSLTFSTSGRNDEFQRTTPGTLQMTLSNRDDSSGGQSPIRFETLGVTKAQWIRVRATWQGTTYNLWQGVIESLLRQWPSMGRDATISLIATDGLKLARLFDLARTTFPAQRVDQRIRAILAMVGFAPGYANTVLAFTPSLYWRMGEPSGTNAIDSSGNGRNGTYGAGVTLAQTGAPINDTDTAALFNHSATGICTSTYAPYIAGSKRTFMGWAKPNSQPFQYIFYTNGGTSGYGLRLGDVSPQDMVFFSGTGGFSTWRLVWPAFGAYVHWAITYDDSTFNAELFLNGVSQGVQNAVSGGGGTGTFMVGNNLGSFFDGTQDEVAVFEYILSANVIAAMYAARLVAPGTVGGSIDTDSDLCDAVTTPFSTGSDALSALLALEGSDNGLLIANGDGSMSFQGRHWRTANATTVTGTFTDDQTGIPYTDSAQYQDDDSRIANVVNVTPLGTSTPVTVGDTASQAKYFLRTNPSVDRSLLSSSASLALSAAQWLLGRYKDPTPRIPALDVNLYAAGRLSTTYVAKMLAAVNSQRFTWKRTTLAPVNKDAFVEQVQHTIDPTVPSWITHLELSPADNEITWILGDAVYGILGSTTKLAY